MTEVAGTEPIVNSLLVWVAELKRGMIDGSAATARLDVVRLEDLVLRLLDLEPEEAEIIYAMADADSSFERCPERFYDTLRKAIWDLRLSKLFARTQDGEYHRSTCPAAYNERTGEHYAEEMARWRAHYRSLSPERKMMTATIVWMYRAGPDSIWLRRVPCTWRASEALHYMYDSGCLALWLQLVATYPGW